MKVPKQFLIIVIAALLAVPSAHAVSRRIPRKKINKPRIIPAGVAFVRLLANKTGVLQDTAAPFNTGLAAVGYSTALAPDGTLLVGGQYGSTWTVVNYLTTGVRNTVFGTAGTGVADAPFMTGGRVRALALDTTGKIIAVGATQLGPDELWSAVRYWPNGTINNAVQKTDFGPGTSGALGIEINPDNSLIFTGFSTVSGGPVPSVITYSSGFVENSVTQYPTYRPGYLYGVKEIGGIEYFAGSAFDTALLSSLINESGILLDQAPPFNTGVAAEMRGLLVDDTGKYILCGEYNNIFTLVRYNANATRDTDFPYVPSVAQSGVIQMSALGAAQGNSLIQDTAGNYYIAGESTVGGVAVFTLIKFDYDGNLQFAVQETGLGVGKALCLAINNDGNILVGGQTTLNGARLPTIIAYTPDGQKITSFGINGVQTYGNFGQGSLNDLAIVGLATVDAVGQMGDVATIMQMGTSSGVINAMDAGF